VSSSANRRVPYEISRGQPLTSTVLRSSRAGLRLKVDAVGLGRPGSASIASRGVV
jgi:hypothetical protein